MSRRNAVWIALSVGMATVVALMIVDRLRRRPIASGTEWAPDPGPQSSGRAVSAATSTGDPMSASTASAASVKPSTEVRAKVSAEVSAEVRAEPAEQPLAMWIRLTIVGVALLVFLAISLIATKSV